MKIEAKRCSWAISDDLIEYHDNEWGVPVYEDSKLFEILFLESMQAGLSWATILRKRENFRIAFDNFDYRIIANYNETKIDELMNNEGIIRHKLKIKAVINNAKQFLTIQKEYGSFSDFIWKYVDNRPIKNSWKDASDVPSFTELSEKISKDLSERGFKFVGPKILYSFMQASGMVNDHLIHCTN